MFRRWRAKDNEYRDAFVMAYCEYIAKHDPVRRRMSKAFWGVPAIDVVRVLKL